jgi:hypothetical protein
MPWTWAEERLGESHNYWIATSRPDGRPHLMVIWGLWLDGVFYFSTGGQSRKARNLEHDAPLRHRYGAGRRGRRRRGHGGEGD